MTFDSITNRAEFFSDHYLDAKLAGDLADLRKQWDQAEGRDIPTARTGLRGLAKSYFAARAPATEASATGHDDAMRALNDTVLRALGFEIERTTETFPRSDGTDDLEVTVAARVETPTGLLLVALDAGLAAGVDELFDTDPRDDRPAPGLLIDPLHRDNAKHVTASVADAPGELFSLDDPPRFVLICGGTTLLLAERAKWAQGRFLAVELDTALERADNKAKGELETIAALFSADALVPGRVGEDESAIAFFDEVDDHSTRHAVGVSKELREGMRLSVEILANEVIQQRLAASLGVYDGDNRVDPMALTRECLRWLYRVIVLLYAESRPELGVLPVDDDAYLAGYSLDRLRELVLVDLDDDRARNGTHLDESLRLLFELVNDGYHAENVAQALVFGTHDPDGQHARSSEDYLQFPGLDATIFDPGATPLLDTVPLRNEAVQRVLQLLMLNRETGKKSDQRGFISYAQLGVNQLGAVYEGLMAYTGFFATEDLYEVAKHGDPSDGTWMLPVHQADEYPEDVFVIADDPLTGRPERVRHERGSFVYRLAGRDRQRSASYYTPEVLTSCVVRQALAELLGTDDYVGEHGGSAGITEARQILGLTICEPALGSGAFLNEAISQLSAEYLKRRQAELGETLDADRYQRELQKVKAHFALHQSYGVDLNATAIELAEVSLWLNCMYPGLKAPWFGLQLREGNSLIGCRRATWRASELKDKVWAKDKVSNAMPPMDRPLSEALDDDEIHQFLLPGHGWGAVGARREAKELEPDEAASLREWRKAILKAPEVKDRDRLLALAAGVERLWAEAVELLEALSKRMRRSLSLYGLDDGEQAPADDRRKAELILRNADSGLGRLRLVMDAWVGLWFWPLDGAVVPPGWRDWLSTLEALVGPEATDPIGQLDLFDDLDAIQELEQHRAEGRTPVADILKADPWLERAQVLAREEGVWHWELELAPQFLAGGFDLVLGNPPWTKLYRSDTGMSEDLNPKWGLGSPPSMNELIAALSSADGAVRDSYLRETASSEATRELLRMQFGLSRGLVLNLYFCFIQRSWWLSRSTSALIHQVSHLTGKPSDLRDHSYSRLRLLAQFQNELKLFEDVNNPKPYCIAIYGPERRPFEFRVLSSLFHPRTLDESLAHDGTGPRPGVKTPDGAWDTRPHADRVLTVRDDVLREIARLWDPEAAGSPHSPDLPRLIHRGDLDTARGLAAVDHTLNKRIAATTSDLHEKNAKDRRVIEWSADDQNDPEDVILQGAHLTLASPFGKRPNLGCANNRDWSIVDLMSLPPDAVPRSNYRRLVPDEEWLGGEVHHQGRPLSDTARVVVRRMVDPSTERTLVGALVPPGWRHIHACQSFVGDSDRDLVAIVAVVNSLMADYLVKSLGVTDVGPGLVRSLPCELPSGVERAVSLRALRLGCQTQDYSGLWAGQFEPQWCADSWVSTEELVPALGDVGPNWTERTPLRGDLLRWQALLEIDVLLAASIGIEIDRLNEIAETQFPVMTKYERGTAFDSQGQRISRFHASAGASQIRTQAESDNGERAPHWRSVWKMFEQWEEDPDSVDWEDQYFPPFTRPDREVEMTRAHDEFQRRLEAGEYG